MSKVDINSILPFVTRPLRYLGDELNSIHKDHSQVDISVALAYADTYEIGQSHLGLKILYEVLNRQPDVVAERVYMPWFDAEEIMREKRLPLFSLESAAPISEFDILGFSLQYEMTYTNLLTMLELAQIPLKSSERDDSHPLVIAGGPCAANPEPLAEFIDFFCLGEGEELILDVVEVYRQHRRERRQKLFSRFAGVPGIYVPSLYEVTYHPDGTIRSFRPKDNQTPARIRKRTITDLDSSVYPVNQIVPYEETIHDRAVLEIFRGCTQGCRFCQAGMIYRPVRERSLARLCQQALEVIDQTGYEEISLLALSINDYTCIKELVSWLITRFKDRGVSTSLPSLRVDPKIKALAEQIKEIRKTGLTIAPEAGTERLRRVINKKIKEEELFETVRGAYQLGWRLIKLYFMIGLPTETEEDLEGIRHLVRRLKKEGGKDLKVSISCFVPKPHTPFQWVEQIALSEAEARLKYFKSNLNGRGLHLSWHEPELSLLEGVFARGDRRLAQVLMRAQAGGARFDSWPDHLRFDIWERAFAESNLDPCFYANRPRRRDEILPWDHIDMGVDKEFLRVEYEQAAAGAFTPDCRDGECHRCGVCGDDLKPEIQVQEVQPPLSREEASPRLFPQETRYRVRIKYAKGEELKYVSHGALTRALRRAISRARLPIAFSEGYSRLPKIAFSPPLPVGLTSEAEFMDLQLSRPQDISTLRDNLQQGLPPGLEVKEVVFLSPRARSLDEVINFMVYRVSLKIEMSLDEIKKRILNLLAHKEIWIKRMREKGEKSVEIRGFINDITVEETSRSGIYEFKLFILNSHLGTARPMEVITAILEDQAKILNMVRTDQFHRRVNDLLPAGYELFSPLSPDEALLKPRKGIPKRIGRW
ncbi:MAG: TIGR03960 family B12-binding radical SAM protein [bacterium]